MNQKPHNFVVMQIAPSTVGGYTFLRFDENKSDPIPPNCVKWTYEKWEEWQKSEIDPYYK